MIATLLNQRYYLQTEIGRGGKGVVYRAHDNLLDRDVAVKVLSGLDLERQDRLLMLQEARSVARLNHPNIVAVYDAGEAELPGHANSVPFFVMELVEGHSLYERKPGSLGEVMALTRHICAALEHAHNHGILHGDVKPENVLIGLDGQAKLMDFGLARSSIASHPAGERVLSGTVFYLAPEQATGQAMDRRSDLYALGVMLYELVTGQLPFTGADPLVIVSQHLQAQVTPPSSLRPDLPPALEAVILKLLSKDPGQRYATAGELAMALAATPLEEEQFPAEVFPNNLPLQFSSFIGRESEIDEIQRLLMASRLVTLTGAGGSGKSRLALQVASRQLTRFPDGIWLVELASITDPALVPQAVLSAVGVAEQAGRPVLDTLTDYLRLKRVLIVLDNCEHLIEACAVLVETLLRKCSNLRILATSREALGIPGENDWQVPSLTLPEPQRLSNGDTAAISELGRSEAVRLFVERAAAVQPGFTLNGHNAGFIAQISQRLDGIPLAIELAAARMKALSVDQIAARLDDRFNLLTVGSRTALPRQQTLRAAIDWSYDLLNPSEQKLFNHLAVFSGGWLLEAAEAICSGEGFQPGLILDLLTRLVAKSLVVADTLGEGLRYRMLETIRQYARQKLLESGKLETLQDRHLEFFVNLAEQAEPELRRAQQVAWLDRLDEEHDNLRNALDWSLARGDHLSGLRLAGALARFWYLRGYWSEGRDWLERVLQAPSGIELPAQPAVSGGEMALARAKALAGAGWLSDESGKEAELYEQSRDLARLAQDRWLEAFALRGLGVRAGNMENHQLAKELLEQSLAIFEDLSDEWGIALARFNLGWLVALQDDLAGAEAAWQESQALFRQQGDRWGMAVSLDALGYSARMQGEYRRAASASQESLGFFRELGDKAGIATSLFRLGTVALRRDEFKQAIELFEESLVIQRELGYNWSIANTYRTLALVSAYQGDYQHALSLLDQSYELWNETGDKDGLAWAYVTQGFTVYYQGEVEKAGELWGQSLDLFQQEGDKNGIAFSQQGLGLLAVLRADFESAAKLLGESLEIYREASDKYSTASVLDNLGMQARAQDDLQRSTDLYKESLEIRRQLGSRRGVAESLEALAGLAAQRSRARRAAYLLSFAHSLRSTIGAPLPPVDRPEYEGLVDGLRTQLGSPAFDQAWARGAAMTLEQVSALALEGN